MELWSDFNFPDSLDVEPFKCFQAIYIWELTFKGKKRFYVHVCICVHIHMCARRDQKTMSDPLELKLHKAVSIQIWVLGTELGSFMSYPALQSPLFNLVVSSCYFSSLHSIDTVGCTDNFLPFRVLCLHSRMVSFAVQKPSKYMRSLVSCWPYIPH